MTPEELELHREKMALNRFIKFEKTILEGVREKILDLKKQEITLLASIQKAKEKMKKYENT